MCCIFLFIMVDVVYFNSKGVLQLKVGSDMFIFQITDCKHIRARLMKFRDKPGSKHICKHSIILIFSAMGEISEFGHKVSSSIFGLHKKELELMASSFTEVCIDILMREGFFKLKPVVKMFFFYTLSKVLSFSYKIGKSNIDLGFIGFLRLGAKYLLMAESQS